MPEIQNQRPSTSPGGLPGAQKRTATTTRPGSTTETTSAGEAVHDAAPASETTTQPDASTLSEAPPQTRDTVADQTPRRRESARFQDAVPAKEPGAPAALPHGDSWASRAARLLTRVIYTDTFSQEFSEAIDFCQAPVATGRRIGVVSPTGGSGASTLTAALAALYGLVRTDLVAGVDLTPAPSGLIARLPRHDDDASPNSGLGSLSGTAEQGTSGQGTDEVDLTDHGPWPRPRLLRLSYTTGTDQALDAEDVAGLHRELSRSHAVAVTEVPRPAVSPALDLTGFHCLIVALSPSPGAIAGNTEVLQDLARRAPGVPMIAVVVDSRRSRRRVKAAAASAAAAALGDRDLRIPVLPLDHDRHLATGAELRVGRIGEARRLQVAQLGAAALGAASGGLR